VVEVSEHSAVPVVILAQQQDQIEFINSTLRKAGHAVHCHWLNELNDLPDTLAQVNCHLLMAVVGNDPRDTVNALAAFKQLAPHLPALIVRDEINETAIAQAMKLGARDVVTLNHAERLQAVVTRELKHFRLEHKLTQSLNIAHEYREQLKHLMSGSADAIAHVQEGILVNPNPAWLTLLGHKDADTMAGLPAMDFFDHDSHAALKGALVACLHGKWPGEPLKVNAMLSNGQTLALQLQLKSVEVEGEPAVQLRIPAQGSDTRDISEQVSDKLERDASTGLLQRRFFIEALRQHLSQPLKGGVRELVCVQPDKLTALASDLGATRLEDFVAQFSGLVKEQLQPGDLAGRFGDCQIFALLERGTAKDIDAWADSINRRIGNHMFTVGEKSFTCTCTIGISVVPAFELNLDVLLRDAMSGVQQAQQAGGNRTEVVGHVDEDTRTHASDKLWVRLIKTALMENRFRLLQQPIVTMNGENQGMHDVLVRMLDELGQEIVPTEFMAAAERHDLMKNIDRWVVGASVSYCATRNVQQLFVRLSKDSVLDRSLPAWLGNQLKATRVDPSRIVIEISEQVASDYFNQTQELAKLLRQAGFKFALEHAGVSRDPARLLTTLPIDYLKIDGSLMQGLSVDLTVQDRLNALVTAAKTKQIRTIAERVEDANTMAALWQLGVDYLQGYFVNEPETVTLG
jgi:multidomain signaling protein FimX